MKVDLHVHTRERSECAKASEEEQIQAAIAGGLDGIAITDHHRLAPARRLEELNRQYAPFCIFGGIEVTVNEEDLLVLGVSDFQLERPDWTYPELYDFVRERGGYIALAHPFRYRKQIGINLEEKPPDALEIYSPNTPASAEEEIRALAMQHRLRLLSNSDAHTTKRLGMYYNLLEQKVGGESELIRVLKRGKYNLHVP